MDTLLAQSDAVRAAVSSVATCTPTTTALLKSLLLPQDDSPTTAPTPAPAPAPGHKRAPSRAKTPANLDARRAKTTTPTENTGLPAKDKAALATQVVNATLRALGDAAKPAPAAAPKTPSRRPSQEGEILKTATRNALRRSTSMPMTPLQPRALNRTITSPIVARRTRSPSKSSNSANLLSTVECARVAFAALRQIQCSGKITLPELQLESGMSALVGKLIALGLHEQAIKELRILKKRLDPPSASETKKTTTKAASAEPKNATQVFAEILGFSEVKAPGAALSLVITTQIQALRILSATKKPSWIEAAVPHLRDEQPASPINLLLIAAQGDGADVGKVARQMETVAQCLLSLTPSVSSKDDNIALESRLSIAPLPALELQALALEARLHWWKMAKHQGDIEKDIMLPLSKCLGAYVRRSRDDGRSAYAICLQAFTRISQQLKAHRQQPSGGSKFPLAGILQTLASLAREAGQLADAVSWAAQLREGMDSKESIAKLCSVAAQLLALHLRDPAKYFKNEILLKEVLAGIQGPLRGDTSELDELLANVCSVRKSVVNLLVSRSKGDEAESWTSSLELLETFILQCPRFCLRWLGKPPEPKSSTKDYLRYDQRRQLLLQSIQHILDSAFMTIKTRLDQGRMPWDMTDSILHDCTTLLEYMGEMAASDSPTSYYVKISHFYYLQYSVLRQQATDPKDPAPLRALRRSVDCVKNRSKAEKEKAQLILKLERMADLSRTLGRGDQALSALQSIRTSLVEDGVLETIAHSFATESPAIAWTRPDKADALSRALSTIARMEQVWMDWTVDLSEPEQAAALEHRLHFILLGAGKAQADLTLEHPTVDALLRIYIPTRFPIRRLRVLLALLCSTVGNAAKVSELLSVVRDAAQVEAHDALGEDTGLASFLPHMKAFYNSMTALVDECPDFETFDKSISAWRAIIISCGEKRDLKRVVDDLPGLLDHLQSIADFARMKGQDSMLATILELTADLTSLADGPRPEDLIHHNSSLALQYTNLGQSLKAEQMFSKAQEYVGLHAQASAEAVAFFHLSFTEHFLAVGNLSMAEDQLSQARAAIGTEASLQKVPRARRKDLVAYASYLHSLAALERGDSHHALTYSRESVRTLFLDWVRLEAQLVANPESTATEDASMDMSAADTSTSTAHEPDAAAVVSGPEFWKIFPWLYRNIRRLSSIYAHLGMFQETMYYAEQARKIAQSSNSEFYKAECAAWMGSVFAMATNPAKALELLQEAKALLPDDVRSYAAAGLACQIGSMYLDLKNAEGADSMITKAETVLESLVTAPAPVADAVVVIEDKMAKLKIESKPPTRVTRGNVRKAPVRKTAAASTKPKAVAIPKAVVPVEDAQLSRLRVSILVQKAASMLSRKEWAAALTMLGEATQALKVSQLLPTGQVAMATCLLGMSLEQMARDPVFSVIQDSTISFPAVSSSSNDKGTPERHAPLKASPPRKARAVAAPHRADGPKERSVHTYVESLREAHEHLLEAHAVATVSGDASLVHRISGMLQNVGLLVAATSSRAKAAAQSGHTAYSVELARNLTWRRERKALLLEKNPPKKTDGSEWPPLLDSANPKRTSLGFSLDLHRFQRDYIDIIPAAWSVVSISLSENMHDLCITKLQAHHSPFVLRLPLERASSRDADNAVFNFQQGRAELLEIVELANATCHDARDMTAKGARSAWWADREALDLRLKELLESIEQIWLGGFRGIFSQHRRRPELLARFQKSFLNTLDKHLPSRQRPVPRGRGASSKTKTAAAASSSSSSGGNKVTLDTRILELFIGLGNADAEVDFDDELTDLLYFVVDILQFHGERNAYDEIDFDSMVVETLDALQAYHAAVRASEHPADEGVHTILLLDKALHVFPWESLPCLQGCAVSRVPSLGCLRRLVLEQRAPPSSSEQEKEEKEEKGEEEEEGGEEEERDCSPPAGHHISATSGTVILNPSSDLTSTQSTFAQPLAVHLSPPSSSTSSSSSSTSSSLETNNIPPPTEVEFTTALTSTDILLYFGHGSGAQYIRSRTIRRLDRCRATVLLMGCSSARLSDAGQFEVYGPAWNYMMAGCPAVVGTLWDVTDRDIDRFAGMVVEEWGVVGRGVFTSSGGRTRGDGQGGKNGEHNGAKGDGNGKTGEKTSLVEAVARARGACRFRYLTAAAVAVYGIPVYVNK
ncbi:peptidase family C50-domain-containing protein [Cercophora scortea]|uniref:separase n=1 Tax=Cercophora scortea TaxID=314031 RepID=A0AAE0IWT0_9PEZI|nr:peptidase family C50-domain-containing protein [Cercophora scortea]